MELQIRDSVDTNMATEFLNFTRKKLLFLGNYLISKSGQKIEWLVRKRVSPKVAVWLGGGRYDEDDVAAAERSMKRVLFREGLR